MEKRNNGKGQTKHPPQRRWKSLGLKSGDKPINQQI
jgi:hypothetical protein